MTTRTTTTEPQEAAAMTTPTIDWAALEARYQLEFAGAWDALVAQLRAKGAGRMAGVPTGSGQDLVAAQVSYGHADEAEVIAGTATPLEIVATSDGRHYARTGWHLEADGPMADAGEWVYFERWTADRCRVAHGYIHPISRKLVQAG